jgi:hypothetical protein
MEPQGKPEEPRIEDRKPSEVSDVSWLYARRKADGYPVNSPRGGKWLVFVKLAHVDAVWEKVKAATEQGLLGGSSKAATMKPNPNATNPDTKVICVYTYDWADEEDVRRVREKLRELGIVARIPYKADADSRAGDYAHRGDKRISKYYE